MLRINDSTDGVVILVEDIPRPGNISISQWIKIWGRVKLVIQLDDKAFRLAYNTLAERCFTRNSFCGVPIISNGALTEAADFHWLPNKQPSP
jgi:hypothetical protein